MEGDPQKVEGRRPRRFDSIVVVETRPVDRYLENLRGEQDGAALYDAVAAAEENPKLAEVYRRLAAAERRHAGVWAEKLNVSAAQIRDAVTAVGSNASDVEEHLKGTRSTTNAEQTKKAT